MTLLHREGIAFVFRWLHVVAGITWIGLLYYFNFVQVPAFAAYGDEARARNVSIEKLASRALWWFRWAAVATVVMGLLIAFSTKDYFSNEFGKRMNGISISTGMLLGLIMFVNVWGVIWRNQKIVLANAARVLGGGDPLPEAAAAGRTALLASRQNVVFSVSMVWFMLFTSHYSGLFNDSQPASSGKMGLYWIVVLIVIAVMELSALGIIGGKAAGHVSNWMYDTVQNTLISAFALWLFFWLWWEIVF
ncbi:MAG: hypothetical protein JWL70_2672 [Acidimicrobiia bacterium]|nr:hypothetical protein [Acidimicrobiia bacterium]